MTATRILLISLLFAGLACKKDGKKIEKPTSTSRQIKSIMESIHDPVKNSNPVEYEADITGNSTINQSFFDPKGHLISKSLFNARGNLEWKSNFIYDKQGNVKEENIYNFDGSLYSKRVNVYDSLHILTESLERDGLGKIIGKRTGQYTSNGNKIITTYSVLNKSFQRLSEQVVNKRGQVLEDRYFTHQRLTREEFNRYDSLGNLIEMVKHDLLKNEEIILHFKYDSHQRLVEVVTLEKGMIVARDASRYDDGGNLREIISYGVMGSANKRVGHSYEFDTDMNWTKDITFVNGRPVSVKVHLIEYY